ncbi:hypothetical protein [Mycobacterium sp. NAZ190054]|uniref:hypothetical protein n=1 Tax=Mycobacterium sp. NAZ190054 TaxID=1747766 RepID=UPI00079283C0|nr:hypothetical protein [Mycobacterium sp. NAZ190054]KWX66975.1 hypothetical protein ASJ79_23535 [Mycobacterium sp. NAZ190054]
MSAYPDPAIASSSSTLVTTATSQPALRTGAVVLGLASLVDLSRAKRGSSGADRVLAMSGAAAAGWFLVEGRRQR